MICSSASCSKQEVRPGFSGFCLVDFGNFEGWENLPCKPSKTHISFSYHVLLKEPILSSCFSSQLSLSRLNKSILSSSHVSDSPVKASLTLHWSFSSWPVSFYRAPKLSSVSRWELMNTEEREIVSPFGVLALSLWLLPGVLLVISTGGEHSLLITGLCAPGLTGLFLQRSP